MKNKTILLAAFLLGVNAAGSVIAAPVTEDGFEVVMEKEPPVRENPIDLLVPMKKTVRAKGIPASQQDRTLQFFRESDGRIFDQNGDTGGVGAPSEVAQLEQGPAETAPDIPMIGGPEQQDSPDAAPVERSVPAPAVGFTTMAQAAQAGIAPFQQAQEDLQPTVSAPPAAETQVKRTLEEKAMLSQKTALEEYKEKAIALLPTQFQDMVRSKAQASGIEAGSASAWLQRAFEKQEVKIGGMAALGVLLVLVLLRRRRAAA